MRLYLETVKPILVDAFQYPPVSYRNWKIADTKDIAAMKILAIDKALRMKDFWDVH